MNVYFSIYWFSSAIYEPCNVAYFELSQSRIRNRTTIVEASGVNSDFCEGV